MHKLINKKIANLVLFALLCSFDIGNWDVFHALGKQRLKGDSSVVGLKEQYN